MGEVVQLGRLRRELRDLQRETMLCMAIAHTGLSNGATYAALAEIERRLFDALKVQTHPPEGDPPWLITPTKPATSE